jgi:acyl carrier protein
MTIDIEELKKLILDAAEKVEPSNGLNPDELLFGDDARMGFDSLDALQIAMAVQHRYGIRLNDSKETRRALSTLNTLAKFLAQ